MFSETEVHVEPHMRRELMEAIAESGGRCSSYRTLPPRTLARAAAIAWDGGPEAARAVSAAFAFLSTAARVHSLTLKTPGMETNDDPAGRPAEYLGWHRIDYESHLIRTAGGTFAADLLVMGGFTPSQTHGNTRHMPEHTPLPIPLTH